MRLGRLGLWMPIAIACAYLSLTAWAGMKTLPAEPPKTWLVYYAQAVSPEVVARFDLVVLDPDAHPPLQRRKDGRPIYLGYLSLGEAQTQRAYFQEIAGAPWLVGNNKNWGSWMVDVRSTNWQRLLLDQLIPSILAQGFDGLFLDTLDTAIHLEQDLDPARFAGLKDQLVELVGAVRSAFPEAFLCANRGMVLWDRLAPYLDAVAVEDFATIYNFAEKAYLLQPESLIEWHLERIAQIRSVNPRILPLTLDYVDPADPQAASWPIKRARQAGLVPYVSDIDLNEVYLYTLKR